MRITFCSRSAAKRYSRTEPILPKLSSSAPTSTSTWVAQHKASMKSPTTQEINSKRLSFFDAPTEPVRINAWSFLGLKKETPKPAVIEEDVGVGKAEEEVKVLI